MCTCISVRNQSHLFGRNLDLDYNFGGQLVIVPRNFPLKFKKIKTIEKHFAFFGMAAIVENTPLFADATNEFGLSIAGLNFEGYAKYFAYKKEKTNITPFELIPYLLGTCKNVKETLRALKEINIVDIDFSKDIKNTTLHWQIADKKECYVIESTKDGLNVFLNPYNVLTNNPPFAFHSEYIKIFLNITNEETESHFASNLKLTPISKGASTFSLPGDFTAPSRFVRAAYLTNNFIPCGTAMNNVYNFFEILRNVAFVKGACRTNRGVFEVTYYSSCVDLDNLIYFLKERHIPTLQALRLFDFDLNKNTLIEIEHDVSSNIHFLKKEVSTLRQINK